MKVWVLTENSPFNCEDGDSTTICGVYATETAAKKAQLDANLRTADEPEIWFDIEEHDVQD